MNRLTWEEAFVQITNIVALRSSCARIQVGAILVKENRIISMGYNGVPKGQEHCCDHFKDMDQTTKEFYDEHGKFSIKQEIHAEENIFSFSARNGIATEGAIMYVSYTPCPSCAKLILQCGIKEVYYINPYDRDMSGKEFLVNNGVKCEQV